LAFLAFKCITILFRKTSPKSSPKERTLKTPKAGICKILALLLWRRVGMRS